MAQLRQAYDRFAALDAEIIVVGPEDAVKFRHEWNTERRARGLMASRAVFMVRTARRSRVDHSHSRFCSTAMKASARSRPM